jgi:plasmid stabilization system protein ParE
MVKKKNFKVIWDRKTLDEFKEILTFLDEQSVQASKIVKKAVLERISTIKSNPNIFAVDKLKNPPNSEFRAFMVFSYRVTYQVKEQENEIRILRIRHTSREPFGY